MMKVLWLSDRKNGNKCLNFTSVHLLQKRALLLYCTGPDVQNIFMHLEEAVTICKASMDAIKPSL